MVNIHCHCVTKNIIYCMSYLTKSFFTFCVTFHIYLLQTDKNTIYWQVLFMIIHEDSNKLYPSMVTRHQMILEFSIIMHQIIHSLEIDTSWLIKLSKLLILLKWFIYRNDYLTFYNNMDMQTSIQIQ